MGNSLAATLASVRWRARHGWRLPVCEDCLASFSRIRGSLCRECGVPIDAVSGDQDGDGSGELFEDVCIACRSEKFHFDRARSFARYQGSLVRAIVLLKFEEMEPLAGWFADRLVGVVRENGQALEADMIVPVPLHKIRRNAGSTRRNCCQNDWPGGSNCRTRAFCQ
jgi:predicted amidophosphoribosyltransferase